MKQIGDKYLLSTAKITIWRDYLVIAGVVSLYWVVSISTVFLNKTLLNSQIVNLDAPLFVTWFQCLISAVICYLLSALSRLIPDKFSFPQHKPFSLKTLKNVLPLSILFVSMVAFNNLCLSYVGVAFYFIGRSLTTVFNVVFSFIILGQKTSFRAVLCCGAIVVGFWLGVDQENFIGSLSLRGTLYGVLGSLSLSLYSIHTKKVLPFVNQHILLLSYYNNLYSTLLFLPLIYLNSELSSLGKFDFENITFWMLMILGGLCGFSIGFVTSWQIKVTSPLTHNISGTAKACAQTVLATFWYNESKPWLWWFSNIIVLFSSATYARIKQIEMLQSRITRDSNV